MIRVFVVDDYQAVRSGIKALLAGASDIEVVGEAADYQTALNGCGALTPDVILVDIGLPGGQNGIDLVGEIVCKWPRTKVIILTASKKREHVDAAMKAGAKGFLTQSSLTEQRLAEAVRTVALGSSIIDDEVCPALFGRDDDMNLAALTSREREVLELLGEGLSNKEIATQLFIDPKTVRNHLNNIYAKLNLRSRVQAAIFARDRCL